VFEGGGPDHFLGQNKIFFQKLDLSTFQTLFTELKKRIVVQSYE
jgi:hypothetical protein